MPNFASIINSHNKKIINDNIVKPTTQSWNCHTKTSCPLHDECLQSSLVYICKAITNNNTDNHPHYIGLTENTFKTRLDMRANVTRRSCRILFGKTNVREPTLTLNRTC